MFVLSWLQASIQPPIKSVQPLLPGPKTPITPRYQFRRGETRGDFARHTARMAGIYRVAPWVGIRGNHLKYFMETKSNTVQANWHWTNFKI